MGTGLATDPFVTNLEDDPSLLQVDTTAPDDMQNDAVTEPVDTMDAKVVTQPDGATGTDDAGADTTPAIPAQPDETVTAKLARLERLERDAEISQILARREEAARAAEAERIREATERQQVDDWFGQKRNQIVGLFTANQMDAGQFVTAMDELAAARVEVANRQMQQQVARYVQDTIDGRLSQIGTGYKERQLFGQYAPELVEVMPQLGDAIERMRMANVPQEDISMIVEAARKAYKAPARQAAVSEAQQAARRSGQVERPTRAARNTRNDVEEDKSIRNLAKEFFA